MNTPSFQLLCKLFNIFFIQSHRQSWSMCPFVALYSLPLHCPVPYPAPHSIWLENLLWPFSAVYWVTAPEHLLIFHQPFFQGTLLTMLGTIWREHFFNCHNREVLFSHASHNYFQFKTPRLEMLETLIEHWTSEAVVFQEENKFYSPLLTCSLNYLQYLKYSDSRHYIEEAKPLSSKKKKRQCHEGQLSWTDSSLSYSFLLYPANLEKDVSKV